ncbi:MAG: hypothetical protein ACIALR_08865 [Blastopirellula sp. JB062]
MDTRQILWQAVVVLIAISAAGCGKQDGLNRGAVQGVITVDGVAVETGAITFVPTGATKGPTTGGKIADGKYEIEAEDGPVLGEHLVQIIGMRGSGKFMTEKLEGQVVKTELIEDMVPAKYRGQSELQRTVEPGRNQFDFELSSD